MFIINYRVEMQCHEAPLYALTTTSFFAADGRAETNGYNFERCGHRLCTVLTQFEARGVHVSWAPYDQLLAPQVRYLLLGRRSIDRPLTPCVHRRNVVRKCLD